MLDELRCRVGGLLGGSMHALGVEHAGGLQGLISSLAAARQQVQGERACRSGRAGVGRTGVVSSSECAGGQVREARLWSGGQRQLVDVKGSKNGGTHACRLPYRPSQLLTNDPSARNVLLLVAQQSCRRKRGPLCAHCATGARRLAVAAFQLGSRTPHLYARPHLLLGPLRAPWPTAYRTYNTCVP